MYVLNLASITYLMPDCRLRVKKKPTNSINLIKAHGFFYRNVHNSLCNRSICDGWNIDFSVLIGDVVNSSWVGDIYVRVWCSVCAVCTVSFAQYQKTKKFSHRCMHSHRDIYDRYKSYVTKLLLFTFGEWSIQTNVLISHSRTIPRQAKAYNEI